MFLCIVHQDTPAHSSHLIFATVVFATFLIGFGGGLGCLVTAQKQSYTIRRRSGENVDFDFWPAEPDGKSCFWYPPENTQL